MELPICAKVWFLGSLIGVSSWTAGSSLVRMIFQWSVGWVWMWSTVILIAVSWWAVACGWFVVCDGGVCDCVFGVLNGIILSCFYSSCACLITVIWCSLCVNHVAGATMSAISRLWSGPVSSFSTISAVLRVWSSVVTHVCLVMWHWCS